MLAGKFLPKPIKRVLTARVEIAPDTFEGALDNLKGVPKPLLVERSSEQ
jgi:hypothetical protein